VQEFAQQRFKPRQEAEVGAAVEDVIFPSG
jgi:hypothetical protein